MLMIGRELKQPLDCLRAEPAPARGSPWLQDARAQVEGSQTRMKERFDATRRVQPPSLSVADWVRIKRLHRQNKLQSFWSEPLQVTKQLGPATYQTGRWDSLALKPPAQSHSPHSTRITAVPSSSSRLAAQAKS